MPILMTYKYTLNVISGDINKMTYLSLELCSTNCSVYTWGNVDAFGSMALIWLPNQISNFTIEERTSAIVHPGLPPSQAVEYKKVYEKVVHTLSGWHSCNNRCLDPNV